MNSIELLIIICWIWVCGTGMGVVALYFWPQMTSTKYLKFVKIDYEEQIRNKDFKLLRKLAGERIGEKYAELDN
ncbi:hypothetical protein BZG01_03745 [Labilibaculum manganireducens]|uniref:Uncharacterized protein n=1 Tax=Labilibaculum manganireducens TaxID=1940525 RepID=A0A2N3IEX0_9BACT|nr:hypothetical protein [Labilibaculum manganireducens]PKQ68835.1 hypothetical protein BZG01_03745 [Labilibaculum manganireducens]